MSKRRKARSGEEDDEFYNTTEEERQAIEERRAERERGYKLMLEAQKRQRKMAEEKRRQKLVDEFKKAYKDFLLTGDADFDEKREKFKFSYSLYVIKDSLAEEALRKFENEVREELSKSGQVPSSTSERSLADIEQELSATWDEFIRRGRYDLEDSSTPEMKSLFAKFKKLKDEHLKASGDSEVTSKRISEIRAQSDQKYPLTLEIKEKWEKEKAKTSTCVKCGKLLN